MANVDELKIGDTVKLTDTLRVSRIYQGHVEFAIDGDPTFRVGVDKGSTASFERVAVLPTTPGSVVYFESEDCDDEDRVFYTLREDGTWISTVGIFFSPDELNNGVASTVLFDAGDK